VNMFGSHDPRNFIISEYHGSAERIVRCDPDKSRYTLASYFRLYHNREIVVIRKYIDLSSGAELSCVINLHFVPPDAAYTFLPPMTFTSTTIIAITSRIWIRPPMVYEVTIPNSHSTIRITQIVQSMTSSLIIYCFCSISQCSLSTVLNTLQNLS